MLRPLATTALLALLVAAPTATAADAPPSDLHWVGDHWTAWNPPATVPDGAELYRVAAGDTLWAIAGRFFGDPYLWPQLWERNQYILDAHWIYPGDPLVVGFEVAAVDEITDVGPGAPGLDDAPLVTADDAADATGGLEGVIAKGRATGAPVPLGTEADIYCSGFIGEEEESFPYRLIGSEHGALAPTLEGVSASGAISVYGRTETTRFRLSNGDIVYLDGGVGSGLTPGELLMAIEPSELVSVPGQRRARVGRFYQYLARVRVLSVQEETAIGEVVDACHPVTVGAALRPFEPQPVPLGRPTALRPINLPTPADQLADAPMIVRSQDRIVSMGEGHLVYINRGAGDDVLPGDVFTIYRTNRPELPPVVLGELAVLSVEDSTALGRIVDSRYSVYVGDLLEIKSR